MPDLEMENSNYFLVFSFSVLQNTENFTITFNVTLVDVGELLGERMTTS